MSGPQQGVPYGTDDQLALLLGAIREMVINEPQRLWDVPEVRSEAAALRDLLTERLDST